MKRGFSIIEITVMLAVVGIVVAMVMGPAGRSFDRLRVRNETSAVASFYGSARFAAQMSGAVVRVEFGADSLVAAFESDVDSVFLVRPGPLQHGVNMSASRGVIRLKPGGVGLGGANTKIVLRRGIAAESLTTSRLGRLKRWR